MLNRLSFLRPNFRGGYTLNLRLFSTTTKRLNGPKFQHYEAESTVVVDRSADEPLTTFCTCEKCGNRWKFC